VPTKSEFQLRRGIADGRNVVASAGLEDARDVDGSAGRLPIVERTTGGRV